MIGARDEREVRARIERLTRYLAELREARDRAEAKRNIPIVRAKLIELAWILGEELR